MSLSARVSALYVSLASISSVIEDLNFLENGTVFKDTKANENGEKDTEVTGLLEKEEPEVRAVSLLQLFRFADRIDILVTLIGVVFSVANGVALPCMAIVYGSSMHEFVDVTRGGHGPHTFNASSRLATINATDKMMSNMGLLALYFVYLAVGIWIASYCQMACWCIASERQCRRIRLKLFHTILRQNVGWFDTRDTGQLNTKLTDDVNKIKDSIGEKLGAFCQYIATTVAGLIIAFVYGWKLALVILSITPLMSLSAFLMIKMLTACSAVELTAYAKAGAVAEEVLSAIRTVVAFGGQDKERERYCQYLDESRRKGTRKWLVLGAGMGFMWFVIIAMYGLGFWYGGVLIRDPSSQYTEATVLIIFFSIVYGAFSFGNATPNFQAVGYGRAAAYSVYGIIDQHSEIDSLSNKGKKGDRRLSGHIQLNNVCFSYPARPDVQVLENLTLTIGEGEKVALVGASGCGKTTVIQLIQRFYDTQSGSVSIGGYETKELNVRWLREQIGVVSQEPVLFSTTISENIRFGRLDATDADIDEAARLANARDFILALPDKYETLVGEGGALLSGGQKQRIAIARALVRNPTILLLDEATSALDNESEAIVQDALEKASVGRTTIVVAHRLSTIRRVERIIAMKGGRAVEEGTHEELMQIDDGVYANLAHAQMSQIDDGRIERSDWKRSNSHLSGVDTASTLSVNQAVKNTTDFDMTRIFKLNAKEWPFIVIGTISALVNASIVPVNGIIVAHSLFAFHAEDEINKICLAYLGLSIIAMAGSFLQNYCYGLSGEKLTMRIRELSFRAMLNQDQSWFDLQENNTGALCTRLATEASHVQGATGARVGLLAQQLGSVGIATCISFGFEWGVTLVVLTFAPFLFLTGYIQSTIISGNALKDKTALEQAGKVAMECIENIRTVASLTREQWFYDQYVERFAVAYKSALRKVHIVGVAFGFQQGITFFIYAATLYFAAWRIQNSGVDPTSAFTVFMVLVNGCIMAGHATSFAPDYAKARMAAAQMFQLIDRVPSVVSNSPAGLKLPEKSFTSRIKFKNVKFAYPTRSSVSVFRGLSLEINPGETVAFVGSSGCGKSTTVNLLERLYDPTSGQVMLDEHDLRDFNVQWLRAQIGLVSQEPVLFDRTIRENIAYGDNTRDVPMHEIIEAARTANIHSFIDSLPTKYDTNVGSKGTQLSGGQKQRVAIARAIVRNPKVLLLDEATSALDTEGEKVVQEALDRARVNRTCIVIAHRLSTIQNADRIFVIRNGTVTESGTHGALLANRRFYHTLVTRSS